jgi:hypothetical protein
VKSSTRTVLAATLSGVSSYSSGPLDVGDLDELLVTLGPTTVSNAHTVTFVIKAVDAFGNLFSIEQLGPIPTTTDINGVSIGAGLTNSGTLRSGQSSFGDQIQVDLIIQSGDTVTTQLSIKGK